MKKYTPLQILIHLYAWSALARMIFDFFMGNLSANPIQDLEQRTGRHAITLLVLSLACTPLNTVFKWSEPIKRRRALGLYAFAYATIHVIIFADLDYGLAWSLLLLIPLGLTSFDVWKKRLGKTWKRVHQLVYLIAPLVVLHYAWSKKGDIFSLQGDVLRPALYGLIVAIFFVLRIPLVRRAFASFSPASLILFPKKGQQPR